MRERNGCTMSGKDKETLSETIRSTEKTRDVVHEDPLADTSRLISPKIPPGVDRRHFLIRSAVGGAAAVMTGCAGSDADKTAKAVATTPAAPRAAGATPPLPAARDVG